MFVCITLWRFGRSKILLWLIGYQAQAVTLRRKSCQGTWCRRRSHCQENGNLWIGAYDEKGQLNHQKENLSLC